MEAKDRNSSKWNVLRVGLIEGLIQDRLWNEFQIFALESISNICKDPNRAFLTKPEENWVILRHFCCLSKIGLVSGWNRVWTGPKPGGSGNVYLLGWQSVICGIFSSLHYIWS